jgi:hypothetical protein
VKRKRRSPRTSNKNYPGILDDFRRNKAGYVRWAEDASYRRDKRRYIRPLSEEGREIDSWGSGGNWGRSWIRNVSTTLKFIKVIGMFLSRLASQDREMAGSKLSCGPPECGGWGSSESTRKRICVFTSRSFSFDRQTSFPCLFRSNSM